MPKKAKEEVIDVKQKNTKKEINNKKVASKKASTDKNVSKSKDVSSNKSPSKKVAKTTTSKSNTVKKTKTETTKKITKSTTKKTSTTKRTVEPKEVTKEIEIVEYYDLPFRYNQTVVKILAQTPNTLFVYWDISDDDRNNYIKQYGEYFFNNTKPVLIVNNKTKNYSYEIDIDDFANSWYLRLIDSDCDYQIELGRRPINEYAKIENNYLYVTTSNKIESPNDRILFDRLSHFVYFKNVKTNENIKKHTNLTLLNKIGKVSTVEEFYKKLYPNEVISFDKLALHNPTSNFK